MVNKCGTCACVIHTMPIQPINKHSPISMPQIKVHKYFYHNCKGFFVLLNHLVKFPFHPDPSGTSVSSHSLSFCLYFHSALNSFFSPSCLELLYCRTTFMPTLFLWCQSGITTNHIDLEFLGAFFSDRKLS